MLCACVNTRGAFADVTSMVRVIWSLRTVVQEASVRPILYHNACFKEGGDFQIGGMVPKRVIETVELPRGGRIGQVTLVDHITPHVSL